MSETTRTPLLILGAGPGGYAAAFYAADLGFEVTLVAPEANPGGVCLYVGCIPSKALLHVAALLNEAREAQRWGLTFSEPRLDLDRLRAWKDEVVAGLTEGLGDLRAKRRVTQLRGRGRVVAPGRVRVSLEEGGETELGFERLLLATGSRPVVLPFLPVSPRVWDSTGALELPRVPRRLLVVGGGIIGLELGSVYASLGSQVSVVEMLPGILPGADRDLVRVLEKRLLPRFAAVRTGTRVTQVTENRNGLKVTLEDAAGQASEERFDQLLVSVGRRPNSEDLGLEHTGVELDTGGFVQVDARRRTADPAVWAIGDLAGQPMLAHKASAEARVAVEDMAGQKGAGYDPAAMPSVVYTDPELAWCGLTETEAKAQGRKVAVARFPWQASGRALTMDRTDGLTKLLIDPETERVLGMGIAGKGAGEMIAEGVLAVEMAALASDVARSIHPHPTCAETVMEAAEVFYGHATHFHTPRRR
ncbi:MAG: dihydrolipoyl dehydrogenase [bacterium]|jgi:dihydrolipoamide dehydrogenase|nr:dihydrolipoyl dehydrogenase [bacterium]